VYSCVTASSGSEQVIAQ